MDEIKPQIYNDMPIPETVPVKVTQPPRSNLRLLLLLLVLTVVGASAFVYMNKPSSSPTEEIALPLPTPQVFVLTVDNLKQSNTAIDGELLVKGKTIAGATVAILSDTDETIVESDSQGMFEASVVVGQAGGLVNVVAYGANDQEKSVTFSVSPVSSVLGKTDNNGKANKEEKLEVKPKATPVVTTLQQLEVKPVKSKPEKESVKIQEKTITVDKEVKNFLVKRAATKPAQKLGPDKLVDLLKREGTESAKLNKLYAIAKMEAKTATAGAVLKRHSVHGIITAIMGNVITITHQTQQNKGYTIYTNVDTQVAIKGLTSATLTDLKVGMRITAAGSPSSDGLMAAKIHSIPGKATGVFKKQPIATGSASPTASEAAQPSASPSTSPSATSTASPSASPTASPSATTQE